MGFIERLIQEEATKAQQLSAQSEAQERERLQREVSEQGYKARRRKQAEDFHQESGVGAKVNELIEFLERSTIPVEARREHDGFYEDYIHYVGREHGGFPSDWEVDEIFRFGGRSSECSPRCYLPISIQKDPNSIANVVHWDYMKPKGYGTIKCLYKYLVVETNPDGVILFHGGFLGSTALQLFQWRTEYKEQIFDKALERAFKRPKLHKYSFYRVEPVCCG